MKKFKGRSQGTSRENQINDKYDTTYNIQTDGTEIEKVTINFWDKQ